MLGPMATDDDVSIAAGFGSVELSALAAGIASAGDDFESPFGYAWQPGIVASVRRTSGLPDDRHPPQCHGARVRSLVLHRFWRRERSQLSGRG